MASACLAWASTNGKFSKSWSTWPRTPCATGSPPSSQKPPLEFHIHSEIYRSRPDVGAIVHAHSTYATTLAICRKGLVEIVDDEHDRRVKELHLTEALNATQSWFRRHL